MILVTPWPFSMAGSFRAPLVPSLNPSMSLSAHRACRPRKKTAHLVFTTIAAQTREQVFSILRITTVTNELLTVHSRLLGTPRASAASSSGNRTRRGAAIPEARQCGDLFRKPRCVRLPIKSAASIWIFPLYGAWESPVICPIVLALIDNEEDVDTIRQLFASP